VQRLGEATTADGGPLYGPVTTSRSADNQLALISVPMNLDPDVEAATDAVRRLRDEIIPPIADALPTGQILVTGLSANNLDFLALLDTYTPIIFAFVLGLSFLLLLVVFRSLVVAAKAIAMNLLSVGAAYGLIVWVFQEGHLVGSSASSRRTWSRPAWRSSCSRSCSGCRWTTTSSCSPGSGSTTT
jgi:RND superfamily putative drug exporter